MKGVPFEEIKDINEKKYYELIGLEPHFHAFNLFMIAKNLGLTFNASELDIEQAAIFSAMYDEINKQVSNNNGR